MKHFGLSGGETKVLVAQEERKSLEEKKPKQGKRETEVLPDSNLYPNLVDLDLDKGQNPPPW